MKRTAKYLPIRASSSIFVTTSGLDSRDTVLSLCSVYFIQRHSHLLLENRPTLMRWGAHRDDELSRAIVFSL